MPQRIKELRKKICTLLLILFVRCRRFGKLDSVWNLYSQEIIGGLPAEAAIARSSSFPKLFLFLSLSNVNGLVPSICEFWDILTPVHIRMYGFLRESGRSPRRVCACVYRYAFICVCAYALQSHNSPRFNNQELLIA